jgi:hypothetical protein
MSLRTLRHAFLNLSPFFTGRGRRVFAAGEGRGTMPMREKITFPAEVPGFPAPPRR